VLVVAGALVGVLAARQSTGASRSDSPMLGKTARPIDGTTIEGEPFTTSYWRGRWIIVNFFATWCPPCIQEHAELVAFDQRHRSIGDAALVQVIFNDDVDAVRSFRRERGGQWPLLDDPPGRIAIDYGVAKVPETYVIDPAGILVAKLVGGVTAAQLDGVLMGQP
jgi:cytochrome c biogenesis protein CcmG/thiol:disulfide interchange protein DsbE